MFIQTEATPNPLTLKFLPGRDVLGAGTMDFPTAAAANASPLARALFEAGEVTGVMLGPDFLTVTKAETTPWEHLKPALLAAIMDHYLSGAPMLEAGADASELASNLGEAEVQYDEDTAEVVAEIKDLIETRVRPAVAGDGGDIVFHKFDKETGVVFLTMRGACAGCPSSTMTLKAGIENLLRHYVPEVNAVEAVV
jgi:Fe-S cluster biogenesis protein NfuA